MTKNGRADIHIHTNASDGIPAVEDVLRHVAEIGTLDVIAITDHDRVDAALWAYEHRHEYPFDIIPGTEVTNKDGHILGLWVTERIPNDMSYAETVAAIHEQGGVAILAHPFHVELGDVRRGLMSYWRNPQLLIDAGFDALEGYNGASILRGNNFMAQRFAHKIGLPATGGSDAHTLNSIDSAVTLFPGTSAEDFRQALLSGDIAIDGSRWHPRETFKYLRARRAGIASPPERKTATAEVKRVG